MKPIKTIEKFNKLEEENEFYGIIYDKKWHSELIKSFLKSSQENLIKEMKIEWLNTLSVLSANANIEQDINKIRYWITEIINKLKEI